MAIEVNNKIIETDKEGYLLNHNDWNTEVRDELIKTHEAQGHRFISDNTRGLINYFRDYYQKNKIQPSMYKMALALELEKKQESQMSKYRTDINYLYKLFPHGPVRMISKLAGLQNPVYQGSNC